ncbi:MAG: sulfite exporter TauE/SafE family protein [Actinomycetota bacterium]
MDWGIAAAGLIVGFLVGLTGMGGGALTTPILILIFHVRPVFAVGTDLVYGSITKWFGAAVHLRQGTVNKKLVRQLATGSIPATLLGVLVLRRLGITKATDHFITRALGLGLILIAIGLAIDVVLRRKRPGWVPGMTMPTDRPWLNAGVGAVVGFLLALTSIGSGTLIMAALLTAYPGTRAAELVGSDVVHASMLVTVAALGHISIGTVEPRIVGSLLVGSIPGVLVGSRMTVRTPEAALRPILATVLLISGVKLV